MPIVAGIPCSEIAAQGAPVTAPPDSPNLSNAVMPGSADNHSPSEMMLVALLAAEVNVIATNERQ